MSIKKSTIEMKMEDAQANNLGINYHFRDQSLPIPNKELDQHEWIKFFFDDPVGVVGTWFAQLFVEKEKTGRIWDCTTFWHLNKGLMVARYRCTFQQTFRPEHGSRVDVGLGIFIPTSEDKKYGMATRYFRIGCPHTNMMESTSLRGGTIYWCPDCRFRLESSR